MLTPKQIAKIYVETIMGPANGWGQHVHPIYGSSHNIMWWLTKKVGQEERDRLLDEEFQIIKNKA